MLERADRFPPGALQDIAFLSRSPNRVIILDALTRGPVSRRDLADETETSRTTLDRIVNELEERDWAKRTTEGDYVATPVGVHLMEQVRPFVDSVEAVRRLGETVAWLPADEMNIGLHHFSDAVVLRPEQDDPMETVDYFTDLIRETTEFRVLTHLAPPTPLAQAMRDRIAAGRLTAEYVLTASLLDYLRERPERRQRWRAIVEGGSTVFQTQGPIPCNLWIFDDTVLVKKSGPGPIEDSYGVPIQSENETVRAWAHDLIDRNRDVATRVGVGTFSEETTASRTDSTDE